MPLKINLKKDFSVFLSCFQLNFRPWTPRRARQAPALVPWPGGEDGEVAVQQPFRRQGEGGQPVPGGEAGGQLAAEAQQEADDGQRGRELAVG